MLYFLNKFLNLIIFIGIMLGGMWLSYDIAKNDELNILLDVMFLGYWFYQLVVKEPNEN